MTELPGSIESKLDDQKIDSSELKELLNDDAARQELISSLENSKEQIAKITKEAFDSAIADILIGTSDLFTNETAFILQTYAVIQLGMKADDIGGVDGIFGKGTLTILRFLQSKQGGRDKLIQKDFDTTLFASLGGNSDLVDPKTLDAKFGGEPKTRGGVQVVEQPVAPVSRKEGTDSESENNEYRDIFLKASEYDVKHQESFNILVDARFKKGGFLEVSKLYSDLLENNTKIPNEYLYESLSYLVKQHHNVDIKTLSQNTEIIEKDGKMEISVQDINKSGETNLDEFLNSPEYLKIREWCVLLETRGQIINNNIDKPDKDLIGITLSGGGGNAPAHLGYLQKLEDKGIQVDSIVGSSAGALIAVMYSLAKTNHPKLSAKEIFDQYYPHNFSNGFKDGISKFKKIKKSLEDLGYKDGMKFSDLKIPVIVSASYKNNGEYINTIFGSDDDINAFLVASCDVFDDIETRYNGHLITDSIESVESVESVFSDKGNPSQKEFYKALLNLENSNPISYIPKLGIEKIYSSDIVGGFCTSKIHRDLTKNGGLNIACSPITMSRFNNSEQMFALGYAGKNPLTHKEV